MTNPPGSSGPGPVEVCVVGSINEDLVVPVASHPDPGETVLGGDWFANAGGKGANQAVAAARLGRRVAFVGCVGSDPAGQHLVDGLAAEGIDVDAISAVDAPTGRAFITVDDAAENRIVVSPGANARLTAEMVAQASVVADAGVVLVQLEVPFQAVRASIASATGRVVFNPAPAPTEPLSAADLDGVFCCVPNRGELCQMLGVGDQPGTGDDDALVDLARQLPVPAVVVTLGPRGALVVTGDSAELSLIHI